MAYTDPSTITFTTGQVVTAAEMNTATNNQFLAVFPDDETGVAWSPTLKAETTDPTTSSVSGVEYTVGAIQFFWARWVISTAGSGDWYVDLPSTPSGITASTTDAAGQIIGSFLIRDDSPGWASTGVVYAWTSTQAKFVFPADPASNGLLTHNNMRAWASGDVFSIEGAYPIA